MTHASQIESAISDSQARDCTAEIIARSEAEYAALETEMLGRADMDDSADLVDEDMAGIDAWGSDWRVHILRSV